MEKTLELIRQVHLRGRKVAGMIDTINDNRIFNGCLLEDNDMKSIQSIFEDINGSLEGTLKLFDNLTAVLEPYVKEIPSER